jgi:hypothetical protein
MSDKHFGFTGFKLSTKPGAGNNAHVPPPYMASTARPGGGAKTLQDSALKPSYAPTFSKKHRTEAGYFEDDDEDDMPANAVDVDLEYQPAPDSPIAKAADDDEDDEDELDAFMAGIEVNRPRFFSSNSKSFLI